MGWDRHPAGRCASCQLPPGLTRTGLNGGRVEEGRPIYVYNARVLVTVRINEADVPMMTVPIVDAKVNQVVTLHDEGASTHLRDSVLASLISSRTCRQDRLTCGTL